MTIHAAITKAVSKQKLTAYFIAHEAKRLSGGDRFPVSINHVNEYLAGRKDMTGRKLDWLLRVLRLEMTCKKK